METNLAAKSKELVWEYRKRKWLALGLLLVSALFTLYLILGVLDDRAERILGTLPVLLLDITIYVTFLVLVLAAFLIRQSGGNRINRVYTEDCDPFLYEACLWELQKNIRRNPMLCNLAAAQYQEGNYDHAWETIQKINPYKLRDGFLVSYYSVLSALYFKRGMGRQVEGLNIGDMVISTDAVQHDMNVEPLGYEKGQIPGMDVLAFPAGKELVEKAAQANREANPEIGTFTGRVASGDQFIAGADKKQEIIESFHAMCAEMEGAAIAQAAWLNGISYVIIRAISDKADNSATMDYPTFEKQAIQHSVRLVRSLLPRL